MRKTLYYGMVGASLSSFIGVVHRIGISFDGRAKMVAGCFSTNAKKNQETADFYEVDQTRVYASYEEMAEKESLTAEQAEKRTSLLDRYARNMKIQSDAESLISAKTGSDCIVVINEEACQVIMEKNTLNDTVILQITEIIEKNTNISAKKLTIIEAK